MLHPTFQCFAQQGLAVAKLPASSALEVAQNMKSSQGKFCKVSVVCTSTFKSFAVHGCGLFVPSEYLKEMGNVLN